MKKLLLLSALLIAGSLLTTSCLDDDDGHTDVTCQYGGTLESLQDFADSEDSILFYSLICEAFSELEVIGASSIFTIDTTVYISSQSYAYYVTDYLANEIYEQLLGDLTLSQVKSAIFSLHSDSLVDEGYASASDIPLDGFSATFGLYRVQSVTEGAVCTYDIDF